MNNYEYLIASLPDISKEWKGSEEQSWENIIAEIKGLCSASDNKLVDALLEGYDDSKLCEEFYTKALASKNKFIREYFTFDLNVRNAKVRYLNKALDRPAGTDIFMETAGEFAEGQKLDGVLDTSDILSRERGIDDLMWEKIDEITTFDYFDIDAVLGFLAKLHTVSRWLKLDPESGKAMFARLVDEVRGSYTGIREAADKAVE